MLSEHSLNYKLNICHLSFYSFLKLPLGIVCARRKTTIVDKTCCSLGLLGAGRPEAGWGRAEGSGWESGISARCSLVVSVLPQQQILFKVSSFLTPLRTLGHFLLSCQPLLLFPHPRQPVAILRHHRESSTHKSRPHPVRNAGIQTFETL